MTLPAAGQVANIDANGRLTIPADVLRAIDWWNDKTMDVVVEAVGPGQLRIHDAATVRDALDELEADARAMSGSGKVLRLAVLVDRYRPGTLYGEKRLQLVKEVAAVLGLEVGNKAFVFAQPMHKWIEVTTLELRNRRLEDSELFPLIDIDRLLEQ